MDAILETLTGVGVFLVGLVARIGIVLVVMLVLTVPILAALGAGRGFRALWLGLQGYRTADGVRFRTGLRYAPGHTWVRPEGARLKVGMDDLAAKLFPWVVAVDLPAAGRRVEAGEPAVRISAGGKSASLASPVSGTVVAVNASVSREPTLVKRDGYGRGWLYLVEPDDGSWRELRGGDEARSWLHSEVARLTRFLEDELGVAAADGGILVELPPSLLGAAEWQRLTRAFLLA